MGDEDLRSDIQRILRVLERDQDLDRMIGDRLIAVASALEHNTAAQLVLRKDVYDMRQHLELREAAAMLEKQQVGERLAKIETIVGIIREDTGAHPLQALDVDDTDKRLGKNVRKYGTAVLEVVTHRLVPWIVAGALGAWHLIEKLAHWAQ